MEQPSKPVAEERHGARRHIRPQLNRAVRRGAGRTTSADTRHHRPNATLTLHLNALLWNPAPVSERALTHCKLLPASTVYFRAGKLQKNHAERQDNNMTPYRMVTNLHISKRLAVFAKSKQISKTLTSNFLWAVPPH